MKPTEPSRTLFPHSDEPLWTTADVARFLGSSERFIFILRKRGLPSIQVGGLIRFEPHAIREWLGSQDARVITDVRARQLDDITPTGSEDNAECAASDLHKEFPGAPV